MGWSGALPDELDALVNSLPADVRLGKKPPKPDTKIHTFHPKKKGRGL